MESSWWDTVWGRVGSGVDYVIDDWIGGWSGQIDNTGVYGLGSNPYPEQTVPVNSLPEPTASFQLGNNVSTYGLGIGVLLLGLVVYKAMK